MLKTITLMGTFLFALTYLNAQDSYIKNRWNIQAGHSRLKTGVYFNRGQGLESEKTSHFNLGVNYGFSHYLEGGIYLGSSSYVFLNFIPDSINQFGWPSYNREKSAVFTYGVNIKAHLLPLFIKKNAFRFDAYLTGKMGSVISDRRNVEVFHDKKIPLEYTLGGGLAFYPGKHLGFFVEYNKGRLIKDNNALFQYGLSLKF